MKNRRIALFVVLILIITCLLMGCTGEKHTYRVGFVLAGGLSKTVEVTEGDTVPMPTDPVKNNYIFSGWFTDSACKSRYDFSRPVTSDLTLYAKFELDAARITNEISKKVMKSIVKVYCESYNDILWGSIITGSSGTSQGSGFCFEVSNGH